MEKETCGRSEQQVTDAEAAALLMNPKALRVLCQFVGVERPAADAARHLSLPLTTLLYWLRRLGDAGLLRCVRQQPRKGRAVKLYRASAERYFVPYHVSSSATPEALLALNETPLRAELDRALVAAGMTLLEGKRIGGWGVSVQRDVRGELVRVYTADASPQPSVLDPEVPALLNLWRRDLRLNFEDAKAFQQELVDLFGKYQRRTGSHTYILHMALAPSEQ